MIQVRLLLNDAFIYEIIGNKVTNRIRVEGVFKVTESHELYKVIQISFRDGVTLKYVFPHQDEASFVSFLLGCLGDREETSESPHIPFSIGFFNYRQTCVLGLSQKARLAFEKHFLELLSSDQFGKENYEYQMDLMNFLLNNFVFESANQIFTVKSFVKKYSKLLKIYFQMKSVIKDLKGMEQRLSRMLFEKIYSKNSEKEIDVEGQSLNSKPLESPISDQMKVVFEIRSNKQKWQNVRLSYKLWEIFTQLFKNESFFSEITGQTDQSIETQKVY